LENLYFGKEKTSFLSPNVQAKSREIAEPLSTLSLAAYVNYYEENMQRGCMNMHYAKRCTFPSRNHAELIFLSNMTRAGANIDALA
jgi:hypothetical protein